MSRRGIGYVAARGSSIEKHGEKRSLGTRTIRWREHGHPRSARRCHEVTALGSQEEHGGNVVALGGGRS